jgi:hypothetical protein
MPPPATAHCVCSAGHHPSCGHCYYYYTVDTRQPCTVSQSSPRLRHWPPSRAAPA